MGKDQEMKNKIADAYVEVRKESYGIEQTRINEIRHPQLLTPPTSPEIRGAPVLIVVCGDKRTFQATVGSGHIL
jgi:hypothetical protein